MYSNKLKLNESKTDCIVIGNTKQIDKVTCGVLKVGSSDIIISKNVKNLGVCIDRKLDMERQVNSICASGYFYLKQLYHMKKYLNHDYLESVVHAFVSCRLDYCNSLLYGINKSHLDKLQRLQNCAARLVTGTHKYEHITPVLKELHWLPVRFRIQYKILLCFKCFYGIAPSYLCDLLIPYKPSCNNFRSCLGNLLHVPGGDRAFSCVAPRLWNQLPDYIKNLNNLQHFKCALKHICFSVHILPSQFLSYCFVRKHVSFYTHF